ncbi:MAG TPA: hypothetical protein VN154_03780 [Rhizomicrobium sp.]|nr:hypothetical protein [Rhizomicrobium sp.]
MFGRKAIAGILFFFAGASLALACGPFFPWQLLDKRATTLKSTPHNSFAYEAAHLVAPPRDRLKPVEPDYFDVNAEPNGSDYLMTEESGIDARVAERVRSMELASTGSEAYAVGKGLPEAVRLYTAGAVDFHKNDLTSARRYFDAVFALPAKESRLRAIWAAYMAGRSAAAAGDAGDAEKMFQHTRQLAGSGVPDPLGLAVASYGEEAKLHYDSANALLVTPDNVSTPKDHPQAVPDDPNLAGYTLPLSQAAIYRNEMAQAVSLYAQQAAHGSTRGVQSLVIVARNILSSADRIDAAISAPVVERLLVAYALARLNDVPDRDEASTDAGMSPPDGSIVAKLPALGEAIERFAGPNPEGADRIAALTYRMGRYDVASRMAETSNRPLAEWVKAKIALQKGDLAAAARHYAAASKGFPQSGSGNGLDADNANLVVGESGTLALARGEYIDALDKLYPVAGTYWGDVAYIAERVLTTDELKGFVDAKVPSSKNSAATSDTLFGAAQKPFEAPWLRAILARRLLREGRYASALSYFDDAPTRGKARAYAAALHEADTDWLNADRAQGYYKAAIVARESGMEIIGYDAAPDFSALDGNFDFGIGQDDPNGAYVTPEERTRSLASRADPNLRYHYRFIAADEASRAADFLPRRSQAFAAVLCDATGWMMQTQGAEDTKHVLYNRYVKDGPHVAWAAHFGRGCPAPDFDGAAALERREIYFACRHFASRHRWPLAGGGAALVVAGLFAFVLSARREKP